MPQIPAWNRTVSLIRAAQSREAELRSVATQVAGRTFDRCTEFPRTMLGEVTRRMNWLELATRHDVELQSRLSRKRLTNVLEQFLDAQRTHDQKLISTLRSELREELQSFATAISDDLFSLNAPPSNGMSARSLSDLEFMLDEEDDVDLGDLRDGSWKV